MGTVTRGDRLGTSTTAIHTGERLPPAVSLTTPIYETSTFVFDSVAGMQGYLAGTQPSYLYSRYDNPTVVAVEQKLAAVDGAEAALVFASGMAATANAIFGLLQSGDEVVCCAAIYGGTYHLLNGLAARFGIRTRFASLEEFRTPERLVGPATKLVWFESPINPDAALRRCARRGGGLPGGGGPVGGRQHVCQRRQSAGAGDGRGSVDAERHQVPQRPQRRDRRGAVGTARSDRAVGQDAGGSSAASWTRSRLMRWAAA